MTQHIPAATLRRMSSMYLSFEHVQEVANEFIRLCEISTKHRSGHACEILAYLVGDMVQGTPDEDLEMFMNAVRDWRTYHEAVSRSKAN